ncbi:MAG: hypothetical protein ACLP05_12955 [Candidatus Kryptoniota bacterium]
MDQFRIVLGIEICKNIIRIAEIEHRDDGFFLSRLAAKNIDSLQVEELVQCISFLISEEAMLGRIASVAIDTTLTERGVVDVDADLQAGEIVNFLDAEIDFQNDFSSQKFRPAYEITKTTEDGFKEVFYAGIDETLLGTIKDACTRCGLDLQFIDLDHSCAELAIHKLLKDAENYILVTVKDHHVEGSFSKNGERVIYKYLNYSDEPFYFVTKIAQDVESAANEYAQRIYVNGSKVDNYLINVLQKNADTRYELLVPTSNLLLSPVVSEDEKSMAHPHFFSSVIGAAIK